uniref:Uncharacterized protein n=1 Tax=Pristionchus pacificus TaxID=54126 RepID=A0A2A6D2H1_PRIPA|eukprot:PDM84507.1 hypothetical protein PRIPAC_33530 [Pristionchus pacificus]
MHLYVLDPDDDAFAIGVLDTVNVLIGAGAIKELEPVIGRKEHLNEGVINLHVNECFMCRRIESDEGERLKNKTKQLLKTLKFAPYTKTPVIGTPRSRKHEND